ncbi:MAG: hypothetical protein JWN94_291 [Betaproteobacteria bacterium]|nr:hypothetical protein [Betaproteobacteria bacterium]
MQLKSRSYEAPDTAAAMELCYANGWTDGLPVVPPTEERIAAMLAAVKLEPETQVAFIENRQISVTAEKIAINAVLAGCKPEYMPVVVAAVEALADPLYGYHGPATSTGGSAVLMIVNGPIARELDMNCGDNLFGPGWRSNATMGRAIRLLMRNTIGTLPGTLDQSSLGHPGKYTYCIAENEAESPWPPLHVSRGFKREQSAVTIMAALGVHQYSNGLSNTPEGILTTACAQMRVSAGTARKPFYAMMFAGEHMAVIAKAGWTRDDVKRFCFENSKISVAELKRINVRDGEVTPADEKEMLTLVHEPDDFLMVMAGGKAGVQSAYIPGWGGKNGSQAVTKEIRRA